MNLIYLFDILWRWFCFYFNLLLFQKKTFRGKHTRTDRHTQPGWQFNNTQHQEGLSASSTTPHCGPQWSRDLWKRRWAGVARKKQNISKLSRYMLYFYLTFTSYSISTIVSILLLKYFIVFLSVHGLCVAVESGNLFLLYFGIYQHPYGLFNSHQNWYKS